MSLDLAGVAGARIGVDTGRSIGVGQHYGITWLNLGIGEALTLCAGGAGVRNGRAGNCQRSSCKQQYAPAAPPRHNPAPVVRG